MSRVGGALLASLLALVLAAATVEAALPGFAWPVQSLGNRGADVRAIQSLLRGQGVPTVPNGIFTSDTQAAVVSFQVRHGLPPTGIVDGATWSRLVIRGRAGAPREAILALQEQLNAKRGAGLGASGVFDPATRSAVAALERHVGLPVDGIADAKAWRYLVAHFDLPRFGPSTGLCDYSTPNGKANWGTAAAVGQLEAAGARVAAAGIGRVAVGDVGLEHAGNIAGHVTHEVGLDVDVRPMRDRRDQCRVGVNYRVGAYNRSATRTLVHAIREAAPGHVKLIWFNDPVLIREGLTTRHAGHDDHLHVRYCEAGHPSPEYRC